MRAWISGLMALAAATAAWAGPEPMFRVRTMEASVSANLIAFVSDRNGAFEVYVTGRDGRGLRQLTRDGAPKDTPTFSADGRWIAYTAVADGQEDIWVMNRDGGLARRLTDDAGNDIHPNWSPDGSRLVFTRVSKGAGADEYHLSLWTMAANGSGQRRLTGGSNTSYGSWSPDGTQLVFWRDFGGQGEIVVADADGSNERRLTINSSFDGWPQWRPDGAAIAFARVGDGRSADIWLLNLRTGAERLLVGGPGRKTSPKWVPEGGFILYDHSLDGELGIWRVAAAWG